MFDQASLQDTFGIGTSGKVVKSMHSARSRIMFKLAIKSCHVEWGCYRSPSRRRVNVFSRMFMESLTAVATAPPCFKWVCVVISLAF